MIGDKIYAYRKYEGLSQQQLADKIGVSRQTVVRWEKSTNKPSDIELQKIEELFKQSEFNDICDESVMHAASASPQVEEIVSDISYGVNEQKRILSDIADKQVTAKDISVLNESVLSSREEYIKKQDDVIAELKKQLDASKKDNLHRMIRTIVVVVTSLLVLLLVLLTWIYWMNHGFMGDGIEGSAEMGTPSYFEIDDGQ